MSPPKGCNPNHPKPGSIIRVEPIRDVKAIGRIKKLLADHPRNAALFALGINTAFRAGDLLRITTGQVRGLTPGDTLTIREEKTGKARSVVLNHQALEAVRRLIEDFPEKGDDELLFTGLRGAMTVQYVNRLVKAWCADVGLHRENYGSHSFRKTWGYHQRVTYRTDLPVLMDAFGHSTQRQTLSYLGITADEVRQCFMNGL